MAEKIVVTSGKGGVGKTTVTANLGIFLAKRGKRVALIDIDFGLNNLDVVLGLESNVVFDMFDVISGRCRPKQALVRHKIYNNLYILPSDGLTSYTGISGQNIKIILESIAPYFDYIILDCPAGIDSGFYRAVSCADSAFVVVNPNSASLRDADKVLTILKSYKLDYEGVIVNRVRGDLILNKMMMVPKDVAALLKTEILGILPEEDQVFLSSGGELPKNSDSYKAYKILADNVLNGKRKIFDVTTKYSGIIGSIRRGLKKSV